MPDSAALARKRLLYRGRHRGMREMDILLGGFAERHLDGFDCDQLARFGVLLELSDPDLYNWISGREPVPAEYDSDVMQLLLDFKNF
jgi:antitoxin CptB